MGQAMYAASAAAEASAGSGDAGPQDSATDADAGPTGSADDDVVDAEIVDDETDGPQDRK
jgi:molecular chaperone DnaK